MLPLKRLTTDSSDDKLLELGIADTVISKVSRFSGLTVRPTSSVRKYAAQDADTLAVARELRVDAVLEGTLQRSGGKLRVTVNLLRVDTGASLWSDTFETEIGDVFAIQDEISRQLAAKLQAHLSQAARNALSARDTSSIEAFQAFQAGLQDFDAATSGARETQSLCSSARLSFYQSTPEHTRCWRIALPGMRYSSTFTTRKSGSLKQRRQRSGRAKSTLRCRTRIWCGTSSFGACMVVGESPKPSKS